MPGYDIIPVKAITLFNRDKNENESLKNIYIAVWNINQCAIKTDI